MSGTEGVNFEVHIASFSSERRAVSTPGTAITGEESTKECSIDINTSAGAYVRKGHAFVQQVAGLFLAVSRAPSKMYVVKRIHGHNIRHSRLTESVGFRR